jgi:hypothetical protein
MPWLYYQEQAAVVGNIAPNISVDLSNPTVRFHKVDFYKFFGSNYCGHDRRLGN